MEFCLIEKAAEFSWEEICDKRGTMTAGVTMVMGGTEKADWSVAARYTWLIGTSL